MEAAPDEPVQEGDRRTRKGHKKSKTSDNPQGKTLKELREIDAQQEVKGNRAKKRKLIDLSVDEMEAIVAAAGQPYRLQKDVAFQYRVSP